MLYSLDFFFVVDAEDEKDALMRMSQMLARKANGDDIAILTEYGFKSGGGSVLPAKNQDPATPWKS